MLLEKPHHPHHQEYQLYLIYYFSLPLLSNFVGMLPRVNFEAYNTKNEAILDEIIAPDYIDHGQVAYMSSPGRGVAGAKNDLKNLLNKFDDFSFVIEAMIASESLPSLT